MKEPIHSNAVRIFKQLYWQAREATHRRLRKVRNRFTIFDDIAEQTQVLWLFTRYVALQRPPGFASTPPCRTKRSVLVISYYSPPYRSIYGTQRITKFMKFLVRMGWEVTLLTTSPSLHDERDDLAESLPDSVHVVRLPALRLKSKHGGKGSFVPDDFIYWVRPAVEAAQVLVRERGISLILGTAPPYSNLLAGAICASMCKLPFVPDFRDPWSRIDVGWIIDKPGLRHINAWMEKIIIRHSARVVITDDLKYVGDFLADASEAVRDKVVSITNGFDEEDFVGIPLAEGRRTKFTVSYVGSLYDQETFDNLLVPFRLWNEHHPEDLRQVEFVYAGAHSKYFNNAGALPFALRDLGYVSHREAIIARMKSDLQLFSQPAYFKPHIYSGKIFEMLRVGVPILAITRTDGAVAALLDRTGAGIAQYRHEDIAVILKDFFDKWKRGERLTTPDGAVVSTYSRETLANRLASTLEETLVVP